MEHPQECISIFRARTAVGMLRSSARGLQNLIVPELVLKLEFLAWLQTSSAIINYSEGRYLPIILLFPEGPQGRTFLGGGLSNVSLLIIAASDQF